MDVFLATDALTAGLVAALFDIALEESAWTGLGDRLAEVMGVDRLAVVIIRDGQYVEQSVTKAVIDLFPHHARVQHLDPWLGRPMPPRREPIVLGSDLFPEDVLVKSRFYGEYAEKLGMLRPLMGDFPLGGGDWLAVGMDRSFATNQLDEADKARLAEVAPYLIRAVQLRNRLRSAEAMSEIGWALVNAWTFGAIVTDANAQVIIANAAAEALARSTGLQLGAGGRPLASRHGDETMRLHALIGRTSAGGPGGTLVLHDNIGQRRLLALVSPMPTYVSSVPGMVLVTLGDAGGRSFDEPTLQAMFGLSASQAALAVAIVDGKSMAGFAAERGVSVTTLRSHLEQVFERTGVHSQRDLVHLLGRIPPIRR